MASASWTSARFIKAGNFTASASNATETTLLGGINEQPYIRAFDFDDMSAIRRTYRLKAAGVMSATNAPPTNIVAVRMSSTVGSATITGAILGVSPTITCLAGGTTNSYWDLDLTISLSTPGLSTNNTTVTAFGSVFSPGFASPFRYALEPTTPNTATWTQTYDGSLNYYINLTNTWGTSDASNSMQVKYLELLELN